VQRSACTPIGDPCDLNAPPCCRDGHPGTSHGYAANTTAVASCVVVPQCPSGAPPRPGGSKCGPNIPWEKCHVCASPPPPPAPAGCKTAGQLCESSSECCMTVGRCLSYLACRGDVHDERCVSMPPPKVGQQKPSFVQIGKLEGQLLFVANTGQGSHFQLYGMCLDCVVAENTFGACTTSSVPVVLFNYLYLFMSVCYCLSWWPQEKTWCPTAWPPSWFTY
jgi:hypothetical protein